MNIKGTKTYENLLIAFAGESQARNRYTYFASQAKKEGYEQIAALFLETADNERAHAKIIAKFLGLIGNTTDNLVEAAKGENYEWTEMYKDFENTAREEGLDEIADVLKAIGEVEEYHENRYLELLERVRNNTVFQHNDSIKWHCRNCGYIHKGNKAPEVCPACKHPRAYYEPIER